MLVGLSLASKPELNPSFKSPHPFKLGIPNTEGSSHQGSLWGAKAFLSHFLWTWCREMLNILCGSSKKPLVHPGLLVLSKPWQIPLDFHPILQQEPGFVGAGSEMDQGRLRGRSSSGSTPRLLLEQWLWLFGLQNLSPAKPNANNLCSCGRVSHL